MGTVRLHPRSSGQPMTIADFAHRLEAGRFVAPSQLSQRLERLLDPADALVVLAVTGPAGSGKSAALRDAARRATEAGCTVIAVDGRRSDAGSALADLADLPGGPTLVVIDDADHLGAGLRGFGRMLDDLPATTRILLGARRLPPRWLPPHLEPLASRLRLGPLGKAQAEDLLERYGVDDPTARTTIAEWAGGLALALVLGAVTWSTVRAEADPAERLAERLTREAGSDLVELVAGSALDHFDPDLLALVVLAGGVDLPLLSALLPAEKGAAETALARLRASSLVEHEAGRVLLHRWVAEVIADRMVSADPVRAGSIVLRVAAHLRDRAMAGDAPALPWLAGLVRDPALRAGLAPPVSRDLYADRFRAADGPAIRTVLDRRWPGAWPLVAPWLDTDAAHVVRRADGAPVAVVAALPLARALDLEPSRAALVRAAVEHGRTRGTVERVVLTPFQIVLADGEVDPDVLRIRNAVALQRCGVVNPRADLVVEVTGSDVEGDILAAYGYQELPELARVVAGVGTRVWGADVGPAGLAGLLYEAVAAEQGQPSVAPAGGSAVLLRAVEHFHSASVLAELPVASPALPPEEAVERVRVWARDSVTAILADELHLLDLVRRRFLEPGATHESVMRDQFSSRATYFRRLRRARDLLGG